MGWGNFKDEDTLLTLCLKQILVKYIHNVKSLFCVKFLFLDKFTPKKLRIVFSYGKAADSASIAYRVEKAFVKDDFERPTPFSLST